MANYGTLTVTNSTISGNSATVRRRHVSTRHPHLTDSTISGNSARFGGGV